MLLSLNMSLATDPPLWMPNTISLEQPFNEMIYTWYHINDWAAVPVLLLSTSGLFSSHSFARKLI